MVQESLAVHRKYMTLHITVVNFHSDNCMVSTEMVYKGGKNSVSVSKITNQKVSHCARKSQSWYIVLKQCLYSIYSVVHKL